MRPSLREQFSAANPLLRLPRCSSASGARTVITAAAAFAVATGCSDSPTLPPLPEELEFAPSLGVDLAAMHQMPNGLYWLDEVVGVGATVRIGDRALVEYEGFLHNGTKFDSSRDRGEPYPTPPIGSGSLIQGWELGIPGMQEGGTRLLVIPYFLGYGSRPPPGPIPPNATLVFRVELLDAHL